MKTAKIQITNKYINFSFSTHNLIPPNLMHNPSVNFHLFSKSYTHRISLKLSRLVFLLIHKARHTK